MAAPCVKYGRMWPLWGTRRTHTHCGWLGQREGQVARKCRSNPSIMRWWDTTRSWGLIMTSTCWTTKISALMWTPKCSHGQKVCALPYLADIWEHFKGGRRGDFLCLVNCLLTGMSCGGFPGPGVEHHMLANPMKDLIHTSASDHSQRIFNHFKDKFQRQYSDEREHERRQQAFVLNLRWETWWVVILQHDKDSPFLESLGIQCSIYRYSWSFPVDSFLVTVGISTLRTGQGSPFLWLWTLWRTAPCRSWPPWGEGNVERPETMGSPSL